MVIITPTLKLLWELEIINVGCLAIIIIIIVLDLESLVRWPTNEGPIKPEHAKLSMMIILRNYYSSPKKKGISLKADLSHNKQTSPKQTNKTGLLRFPQSRIFTPESFVFNSRSIQSRSFSHHTRCCRSAYLTVLWYRMNGVMDLQTFCAHWRPLWPWGIITINGLPFGYFHKQLFWDGVS